MRTTRQGKGGARVSFVVVMSVGGRRGKVRVGSQAFNRRDRSIRYGCVFPKVSDPSLRRAEVRERKL